MHALICAAAGLTVSLAAASVSNAAVRGDAARIGGAAQFEVQSGLNYTSVWNRAAGERAIPATETYGVVMLAQDSGSAYFIDDVPDTFNFTLNQDAGANLITGAATRVDSWQVGNVVTVAAFTTDSSEWIPAGTEVVAGDPLDAIRMDVGAFANAGADGINGISYPGFSAADVVSVDMVLFIDGAAVFSATATATDFSDGLGAVGVVGGAAGAGIDEMHIVFNLNVPTPGAVSVFGLAGLAAVRRRRH